MKKLVIVLAVLALFATLASAKISTETASEFRGPNRANTLFDYFDMSDPTGFTTVDLTATATPHFHPDTYFANGVGGSGGMHWWCGTMDFDADGGYGNSWDDLLTLPDVDITGATYPILTFWHYYDSEPGYDYTYVQEFQGGAWVNLNAGYNGLIAGGDWVDIGVYGFVLTLNNPAQVRFEFIADGAWSDEDGLYNSIAGAYHVDDIQIFDFYTGTVFFMETDADMCMPGVPASAGDYWGLVDDVCSSVVIPSWWCGDPADTSLIPPNLANALITPMVDITGAVTCTLRMAIHAEVPTVDNDYWNNAVSFDGVEWFSLGSWWGDFEQCGGFGTSGLNGEVLDAYLPQSQVQYRLTFYTTDNGCGPGAAGGAGVNLDDTWVEGEGGGSPVEQSSWGRIKGMYRQ